MYRWYGPSMGKTQKCLLPQHLGLSLAACQTLAVHVACPSSLTPYLQERLQQLTLAHHPALTMNVEQTHKIVSRPPVCMLYLQEQQAAAAAAAQAEQRAAQLEELLETVQGDLAAAQGAGAALEGRLLAAERRAEALVGEHAAALAAQQGSTAAQVEERVQARVAGAHEPHHLQVAHFPVGLHSGILPVVVIKWLFRSMGCAQAPSCLLMVA